MNQNEVKSELVSLTKELSSGVSMGRKAEIGRRYTDLHKITNPTDAQARDLLTRLGGLLKGNPSSWAKIPKADIAAIQQELPIMTGAELQTERTVQTELVASNKFGIDREMAVNMLSTINQNWRGKPFTFESFVHCLKVAVSLDLNPLKKQIYFVPFRPGGSDAVVLTPITSIDGYRAIADRTGLYGGCDVTVICDKSDNIWGARATARKWLPKANQFISFTKEVPFREYTTGKLLWHSKPATMICKVAEAHVLRMAFPEHYDGVYSVDEIEQDNDLSRDFIDIDSGTGELAPPVEQKRKLHDFPEVVTKLLENLKLLEQSKSKEFECNVDTKVLFPDLSNKIKTSLKSGMVRGDFTDTVESLKIAIDKINEWKPLSGQDGGKNV